MKPRERGDEGIVVLYGATLCGMDFTILRLG